MNPQTPEAIMVDQKQVEAAITNAAPKIKGLPADWINESALPPICFVDGKPLNQDAVRYGRSRENFRKIGNATIGGGRCLIG